MVCTCSDETFTFNLFKQNGVYKVEKCGRLKKETGKKKSCEFYRETLIEERKINSKISNEEIYNEEKSNEETMYLSKNINYRRELFNYIDMCEKFGINENYAGNIVYLLNVCGYRYIPQEKLSCLKTRLNGYPDKLDQRKTEFPIILVELPDNLKTKNMKKSKIKKKFEYEIISEDDTESEYNDSENSNDENYTFDVEEVISEEEIEEDFDIGYSSD